MTLWFLTDTCVVWTRDRLLAVNTPDLGGGVDGAEAMTVGLCQHLARRGHAVTLWASHCEAPGTYGAVRWRSIEQGLRRALLQEPTPDVFVSVRRPEVFALPECDTGGRSAFKVLWTHDVWDPAQADAVQRADAIVYMSQWHRQQWEAACPALRQQFFGWVTPAAMDPSWLPRPLHGDHDRTTFIYGSRPERGLGPLLELWPRLREALPGATLIVTGYTAGMAQLVRLADAGIAALQAQVGGIELARSPDKRGFYRQLRRARALLYPGVAWFEETNGHVCSEAMVCGTIPIVTRIGALTETIPDGAGVFVSGDASTAAYQRAFLDRVVALASPDADAQVAGMRQIGRSHVLGRCSYDAVADLWDAQLRALPVQRKGIACLS